MLYNEFQIKGKVWVYPGDVWRFVSLPKDQSAEIKELFGFPRRGFGSIKVEVELGESVWKTSIFPQSSTGCYMLPLKASVRQKEKINDDSEISFLLRVLQ